MINYHFTEFRFDGWPLCPACEDDSLYSLLIHSYDGLGPMPTLEECLAGDFACKRCQRIWSIAHKVVS